VLRVKIAYGPGYLTVTYPGEFFGHGFASPGTSVFRNSLFVTTTGTGGELPYDAFGLLALFSKSVDEVAEVAQRHGVRTVGHVSVSEASGRTVGFELCQGRVELINGRNGLYAHSNHTVSPALRALVTEKDTEAERDSASQHRERRLYELMEQERGRLTPQIMLRCLADHAGYPLSICRHHSRRSHTTAAIVVEPSRGLLHVTRGNPCQNWPTTYTL